MPRSFPEFLNLASISPDVELVARYTDLVSILLPLLGVTTTTGGLAVDVSISPDALRSVASISTFSTRELRALLIASTSG